MSPIPLPEVAGPNELLGRLLLNYQEDHPRGSALDDTLPQQYVRTRRHLRLADRLIWTGLGRLPDVRRDLPSIAVEFVSGTGPRAQQFYYADKREEYLAVGIREYWIFDRFRHTLTVVQSRPGGPRERVLGEGQTYRSPLLPGFQVPVGRLLAAANRRARKT